MAATSSNAQQLATSSWDALGTSVVLRLSAWQSELADARAAAGHELDAIDLACSRFRADSELSRVNAQGGRWLHVGPLLLEALTLALRAAVLTDGDVEPTVGRALELIGYDRDWKLLEPPAEESEHAPALTMRVRGGWRAVELDPATGAVRVPAGVQLDLGATAKAWAADRAAAAASGAAGCGVLVSLGGDIATCGPAPANGWRIHVTDDHRSSPSAPGQTVSIRSGGLATSSTTVRRWNHAGHTMHHILDPDTGTPVQGRWRAASVAAGSCADANIATTAALIRGEAAPAWLDAQGLPARLLDRDGSVRTLGGWPPERTPVL